MAITSPMAGREGEESINAPFPCRNFTILSTFSFFTLKYFSIQLDFCPDVHVVASHSAYCVAQSGGDQTELSGADRVSPVPPGTSSGTERHDAPSQ